MLVDRPSDVFLTLKNGKQALISYSWGSPAEQIPDRARVIIESATGFDTVIGTVEGPFDSLDQVNELGGHLANAWVDRQNG
ncbi:MAG: hypothetical protein ACRERX_10955 [Pseudomonas sp.]